MHLDVSGPFDDAAFRWSIEAAQPRTPAGLIEALEHQLAACASAGGGPIQLWLPNVDAPEHQRSEEQASEEQASGDRPSEDETVAGLGFVPYRDLWRLEMALPAEASGLDTRSYTPDDADAFLATNNRAFHWHPEQGGMTLDALEARRSEPWHRDDGFRLLERSDRLAGFCWTKIHADEQPPIGEIYVIAIDPDFHGQGLGRPMTLAGLEWLHAQGLTRAMLYVESDNEPANRTYQRIGFERSQTNRAYRFDPHVSPGGIE